LAVIGGSIYKEFVVEAYKDGRICLMGAISLGGSDQKKLLYVSEAFSKKRLSGTTKLASWKVRKSSIRADHFLFLSIKRINKAQQAKISFLVWLSRLKIVLDSRELSLLRTKR
jgi:hypothetical protein